MYINTLHRVILLIGHLWDQPFCPLYRGCPLSEVIFYRVCIHEYFIDWRLSSFGMSFIEGFTACTLHKIIHYIG